MGPFGATRGNFDFGRSKNAAFYEKTRIVRCKNAFLRYENCVLELEIAKKYKKKMRINSVSGDSQEILVDLEMWQKMLKWPFLVVLSINC